MKINVKVRWGTCNKHIRFIHLCTLWNIDLTCVVIYSVFKETLRFGYRKRKNTIEKLFDTMKFVPNTTQRGKIPFAFVQNTQNEANRSNLVNNSPPVQHEEMYAYENIGFDDIAAGTPDPEDMRTLNIDPNNPDIIDYDNKAQMK